MPYEHGSILSIKGVINITSLGIIRAKTICLLEKVPSAWGNIIIKCSKLKI